jgi:hypothetical protein
VIALQEKETPENRRRWVRCGAGLIEVRYEVGVQTSRFGSALAVGFFRRGESGQAASFVRESTAPSSWSVSPPQLGTTRYFFMSIVSRPANLQTDEQLIIDFLQQNHTANSNQKRFAWLYRSGPAGEARVWIANDSETGAIIGVAAAFPRRMYVEGKEELAWVLGDFCIANRHRSLGPAVQLQRACLAGLDSGCGAIYYDFPSEAMTAVYQRLGVLHDSRMVRLAKLLRTDNKLRSIIRHQKLARIFAFVGNAGLALRNGGFRLPEGLTLSLQESPCGSEFTRLSEKIGSTVGICLQRSAEYLNWRYRQHPFRAHEIFALHRGDSLVGYAVVSQEDHHLNLVDLFGEEEAIPTLVRSAVSIAQQQKLETVTVGILAWHPWATILRNQGFHDREKYPVVICKHGQEDPRDKSNCWFLMNGDRES